MVTQKNTKTQKTLKKKKKRKKNELQFRRYSSITSPNRALNKQNAENKLF